jgi:hypothetical protein
MKWVMLLVLLGVWMTGRPQGTGFVLEGQGSVTIPVTWNKMTNVVFPSAVRVGVKVSLDVLAQKVRGVENVIELKAMRRGFVPTNLSVYGVDGRLYSFVLRYVEDTAVLNYRVVVAGDQGAPVGDRAAPVVLSGPPVNEGRLAADAAMLGGRRAFLHVSGFGAGLRLQLRGIWYCDSLQWFCLSVQNRSVLAFSPGVLRFYLQDRARVRRRAVQELELSPVYGGPGVVAGGAGARFLVAFTPFTVPPGKRLIIDLVAQDGRQLRLHVNAGTVMRVQPVNGQISPLSAKLKY